MMNCDEFSDLIDKIAEEQGFKCEYVLVMGNEEGKLHSCIHAWHPSIKPCKQIRFLSKILGISCKRFEKIMKK